MEETLNLTNGRTEGIVVTNGGQYQPWLSRKSEDDCSLNTDSMYVDQPYPLLFGGVWLIVVHRGGGTVDFYEVPTRSKAE